MEAFEGLLILFGITAIMVFFIGSIMLIKGTIARYLAPEDGVERWKQRAQ